MDWLKHAASGHGFLTLSGRRGFPFIPFAIPDRQLLRTTKFHRRYRRSCQSMQRVALSRPRTFAILLQARNFRSCLLDWESTNQAFQKQRLIDGLQNWDGATARKETGYILTGTKEMTSWPIDRPLFVSEPDTKCDSHFGTPIGICVVTHLIQVPSFSSPTKSLFSSKTTRDQLLGAIKTATQPLNWKVRGNPQWKPVRSCTEHIWPNLVWSGLRPPQSLSVVGHFFRWDLGTSV